MVVFVTRVKSDSEKVVQVLTNPYKSEGIKSFKNLKKYKRNGLI